MGMEYDLRWPFGNWRRGKRFLRILFERGIVCMWPPEVASIHGDYYVVNTDRGMVGLTMHEIANNATPRRLADLICGRL